MYYVRAIIIKRIDGLARTQRYCRKMLRRIGKCSSWLDTISETCNFLSGWNIPFDDELLVVVVERLTRESCCTAADERDIFFPCHLFDKTCWIGGNMFFHFLEASTANEFLMMKDKVRVVRI